MLQLIAIVCGLLLALYLPIKASKVCGVSA
jgi:hypothetical protein